MDNYRENEEIDNKALIGLGAFLIGAAMALPSKEKAAKLNQFQSNEQLFNHFKLNQASFNAYLRDKSIIDEFKKERLIKSERWKTLGDLKLNASISNFPKISSFFNEAVNLYFEGFFRNACISCAIVMEALLKKKFGDGRLVELIDKAEAGEFIGESEKHHLHGIRLDRNNFVHTLDQDVNENDARIVILITAKIVNKIT